MRKNYRKSKFIKEIQLKLVLKIKKNSNAKQKMLNYLQKMKT